MISTLLLRVSTLFILTGMLIGIGMGIGQDFTLAPAHAHLNLIGFVLMFLAGLFYRAVPAAEAGLLPRIHATLHILGAILFPLGIGLVVTRGTGFEPFAIGGRLSCSRQRWCSRSSSFAQPAAKRRGRGRGPQTSAPPHAQYVNLPYGFARAQLPPTPSPVTSPLALSLIHR